MAIYEWICKECNVYWDAEHPMGEAPKQTECPKCSTLGNRYWQSEGCAISFKDDGCGNKNSNAGDFHTVKQRYRKFNKEGYDQDSANTFLHRSIRQTKERMEGITTAYKPVYLRPDRLVATGEAKALTPKESAEKIERARKLTIETYDKAKIDPIGPTKQY